MSESYLAARIDLEHIPYPSAPQCPLIPVKHVLAGLISEEDGPARHGSVTHEDSLLLVSERTQQCCSGVLLQQDLLVPLDTSHHHLCQI